MTEAGDKLEAQGQSQGEFCQWNSYHISTTELPEQQEKPGNKKDLND